MCTKIVIVLLVFIFDFGLARSSEVIYVTDLEGDIKGLLGSLHEQGLRLIDGRLEFTNPNQIFVFGGDLLDRGTESIQLLDMINDLALREPGRVLPVWGNRDIKYISLMTDLKELEDATLPRYQRHLSEVFRQVYNRQFDFRSARDRTQLRALNSSARQLQWWFGIKESPEALDNYQKELARRLARPVSLEEAAKSLKYDLRHPNGRLRRFLGSGRFLLIQDGILYSHIGANGENRGYVPGERRRRSTPQSWVEGLNGWAAEKYEKILKAVDAGRVPSDELIAFGDLHSDRKTGRIQFPQNSTSYPSQASGLKMLLPDQDTIAWLRKGGIKGEVIGHQSPGYGPMTLTQKDFFRVMGDLSRSGGSKIHGSIRIIDGRTVELAGATKDGKLWNVQIDVNSPNRSFPVGKMDASTGVHIVSKTSDGQLVGFKYAEGFEKVELLLDYKPSDASRFLDPSAESLDLLNAAPFQKAEYNKTCLKNVLRELLQ